jgi:hypothetical protein
VCAVSSKQKIVSKDSTEAELAALSDKVLSVVKCNDFMHGQGYNTETAMIHQDNNSCISLVTTNGGVYRTKYFKVRMARVKELVEEGLITIGYLATSNMLADLLTKPLQGTLFSYLLHRIIGSMRQQHGGA